MIPELFRTAARQYRDQLAIVDGLQRITYGGLLDRIGAMEQRLRSEWDVKPGDVIAASMSNSWQFIASFFAVSGLGGVFAPCNPHWRSEELRWFAERLAFRGVIAELEFRAAWEQVGGTILTVDDAATGGEPNAAWNPSESLRSEHDPALYLPTSGSTGVPRVVSRSHRNLAEGSRNVARALAMAPGRRFLSVVPFYHSNGFHNSMLMPLLHGGTLVLMRRFSPAACHELIHREGVEVLIGSPFIFSALADSTADPAYLSTLKQCFSGGARLPAAVSERWTNRGGSPVRQWYGTSETSTIALGRIREASDSVDDTSVGVPINGVDVKVLDAGLMELKPGTVGELAVRSAAVMSGYVGEPELNRRVFHDGFYRTGDFGFMDSAGNLYLAGRMNRVMNISGVKIDPFEIERAVEALSGVSRCHVDTVPDGRGGEMIRARVLTRPGFDVTRRAVIAHCRSRLAEYKLPRIIEFAEAMPTMVSGKMPAEWSRDVPGR
jgi:long-chain acyl-CoA synthetase